MSASHRWFRIFLPAALLFTAGAAGAGPVEDFARRYDELTHAYAALWEKGRQQNPENRNTAMQFQVELLELSKRMSLFEDEVSTYHQGVMQTGAESQPNRPVRPDERLLLMALGSASLGSSLDQLAAYFEIKRPEYLRAATRTHEAWQLLERVWRSDLSPQRAGRPKDGARKGNKKATKAP